MTTMLLFDIDGTLLLSGGCGKVSFEKAFEDMYGVQDTWGDYVPDGKTDPIIFGDIARNVLERPVTPQEMDKLFELYIKYFRTEIHKSERFRLMPGVPKILEDLSNRDDLHLGIATGNISVISEIKLAHAKLDHFFSFGGFASDSAERFEIVTRAIERGFKTLGESLNEKQIFVIGDAPQDIQAAKKVGVRTISVLTGSTPREKLEEEEPHCILEDLTDIAAFLKATELA